MKGRRSGTATWLVTAIWGLNAVGLVAVLAGVMLLINGKQQPAASFSAESAGALQRGNTVIDIFTGDLLPAIRDAQSFYHAHRGV